MITDDTLAAYPLTTRAWDILSRRYVVFQKTLKYLREHFDQPYLEFSEGLMQTVEASPGGLEGALKAFIRYSNEYLVLQARLNKDGRYLHSSYAEVNRSVYQGETMDAYYLDGLFLSQALWPNHYRMGLYFLKYRDCAGPGARVMDVPTGPGFYSLLFARHFQFAQLDSFDISARAIEYTRRILAREKPAGQINLRVANILEGEAAPTYDFICCGELLEHLEDPRLLLAKLKTWLKPGKTLFLTTAIYAAAIDHIFLMRNVGETRALLREFFTIESELILPVTLEDFREDMDRVPINYACVLK
jgi:2-polyprenyl-3-methyl-5-hydroxy-6-metoxy-1,4-benzoquinol methylase